MKFILKETGEEVELNLLDEHGKDRFYAYYHQTVAFQEDFVMTEKGLRVVSRERLAVWQKVVKKEQELSDFLLKDKKQEVLPTDDFLHRMKSSFDMDILEGVHYRMDLVRKNIFDRGMVEALKAGGDWDTMSDEDKDNVYKTDIEDGFVVEFATRHE